MIILFILGLLLGAVSVIFALQNIAIITVTFFSWQLTGSLAVILLFALAMGIIITVLLLLPELISNHFKYRSIQKDNEKLYIELQKQKELILFAKHEQPTQEEIYSIEHGAIDMSGEVR